MKRTVDFRASDFPTIGMELEFQLLDARTLELADGILPLMAGSPYVKPEVIKGCGGIGSTHSLATASPAGLRSYTRTTRLARTSSDASSTSRRWARS